MARLSSRELALERRKALTTAGKKASVAVSAGANRVRSADDARKTRTNADPIAVAPSHAAPPVATERPRNQSLSTSSGAHRSRVKPVSQPSRELVLARREALSRRGKSADKTKDRNRAEVARQTATTTTTTAPAVGKKECGCGGNGAVQTPTRLTRQAVSVDLSTKNSSRRSQAPKRRAIENPSRALVLARREAMSKHGKTAGKQPTSAAAVARQANPDLTSRELAQQVRELRAKSGARS